MTPSLQTLVRTATATSAPDRVRICCIVGPTSPPIDRCMPSIMRGLDKLRQLNAMSNLRQMELLEGALHLCLEGVHGCGGRSVIIGWIVGVLIIVLIC